MTWNEIVKRELAQARKELAAAEEGLKGGTPAAHSRYTRALHEVEVAEQRAHQVEREPQWAFGF
jgi:hypothetical protein